MYATLFDDIEAISELKRAVLAYTGVLVFEGGRVAEPIFSVLKAHLSDEEILELTYITALYDMHAVMCRALRLEYDDVEERIVEIAAPEDEASDIMSMVGVPGGDTVETALSKAAGVPDAINHISFDVSDREDLEFSQLPAAMEWHSVN